MNPEAAPGTIHTVGHSNRDLDALIALLRAFGIERLADVRRYPGSRRHPHFASAPLGRGLAAAGILYRHFADLGGYRAEAGTGAHAALDYAPFRAYADHMATPAFRAAVEELLAWNARPVAVLCAEANPRDCHRGLLADALVHRGVEVVHILGPDRSERHRSPVILRWEEDRPIYDGGVLSLDWTSLEEEP